MKCAPLEHAGDTVLVVRPDGAAHATASALQAWLHGHSQWARERLHRHGALLFRGFAVDSPERFETVCSELDDRAFDYVGGESPRTAISGSVYTSTEYPAHLEISLHNEMSYAPRWPRHLFFCCLQPASSGGQTPLASSRAVLEQLDAEVRHRFEERGVKYFSNYHDGWGLGKSWQQAFLTDSKEAVERHCTSLGIDYQWRKGGLRTRSIRPALARHPESGALVWFNQADRWHVACRGQRQAEAMMRTLGEDGLPRHARFGDDSEISPADLAAVHAAYRQCEILFDWQAGDVLMLDNILVAHGRKPFRGDRQVIVTMAGS